MGMMDEMQDNMSDMRTRFEELKMKEQNGDIDDEGRSELQQLRSRLFGNDM
jgi:hypothetical protein